MHLHLGNDDDDQAGIAEWRPSRIAALAETSLETVETIAYDLSGAPPPLTE